MKQNDSPTARDVRRLASEALVEAQSTRTPVTRKKLQEAFEDWERLATGLEPLLKQPAGS